MQVSEVVAFIKERRAHMDNLSIAISAEMDANNDHETIVSQTLMDRWNDLNYELQQIAEEVGQALGEV